MVAARRAVARMIDTLTGEDRVTVMAFDNSVEHCGDMANLAPATDRHRWSVLEWLGSIEARGGTQLAAALKAGFGVFREQGNAESPVNPGPRRDRVFVLVTDCQVGDEDRVIANLVDEIGDVTLFVVGIDTAVNEGLLTRMADSTGGMVEMVESEDRLDEVMERIHQRLVSPLVSGLGIQPAGLDIITESLVPAKLPNLVPGVPVVVRGRYRGTPTGGVCVEGRRPAGDVWQEQADAAAVSTGCQGSLWARGRLRHLEDLYASRNRDLPVEGLEKQMVELSSAFGVLCRFTAIVAIDPRHPDRKPDPASLRRIVQPVEMVAGMGGILAFRSLSYVELSKHSVVHSARCFREPDHFEFTPSLDPMDMVRAVATEIVAKARPKSGALGDVKAGKVRRLLKSALAMLRQLGACGAPREMIESLATAYGRLYALPADLAAIAAMLDTLADIAELSAPGDRWWRSLLADMRLP